MTLFTELGKKILKFYGTLKPPKISKAIFSIKNKEESITLLEFTIDFKAVITNNDNTLGK